jgi:RNA polymerase sigma-70 factor (ECF subfamily)
MHPSPDTRPSLLVRIRDGADSEAWQLFVDLYGPLVYGLGRKHGLQDADAADLTQDVLQAVAAAVRSLVYDPRRGSFRGWLYTIARNRLLDFLRRKRLVQGSGDAAVQELLEKQPAPAVPEADWDRDYERRVFAWAAERVRVDFRPHTWQAFWLTAVEGLTGEEAAGRLGMSLGAVQVARSRVLARLKETVRPLLEE